MNLSSPLDAARKPAFLAMIHVGALPGTPRAALPVERIARQAADEAKLLADHGVDAIVLENMHDVPYLRQDVGPEVVAAMTAVCTAVRQAVALPLGVQVLAGANRAALAVAHAAGCRFIRAENFVFAHVADEGLMPDADAGPLLRYRRQIGADAVAIYADIKKKHAAHALTADVDLAETARAAQFFGAAAIIITGSATGRAASPSDVAAAKGAVRIPVLVGSGTTLDNLDSFLSYADGLIVGSFLKRDGLWSNPPDPTRVAAMRAAFDRIRST